MDEKIFQFILNGIGEDWGHDEENCISMIIVEKKGTKIDFKARKFMNLKLFQQENSSFNSIQTMSLVFAKAFCIEKFFQ